MPTLLNAVLLFMRVGFSLLMMTHGLPKLQRALSDNPSFADPIGIGELPSLYLTIFAELVAPVFVIFGFKTRLFAATTTFTMAVAAFIAHGADPLAKKEMALLYLIGFLSITLLGAGRYAIDGIRKG